MLQSTGSSIAGHADLANAARRLSGSAAGCSFRDIPVTHYTSGLPRRCKQKRLLKQKIHRMICAGAAAAVPAVRVVTKDSLRVKRISAEIQVQANVEQVWSILTGYNKLADFVPNLDLCERMPGAPPGKQRLRQRACSQSLYWRLQAEAIVDVQKVMRSLGRRELHFTMVEGDFQEFSGRWIVEPDPTVASGLATSLRYEVSIVPKWSLPSTLITAIVRCGLPANVRAIATQAEKLALKRRAAPRFASAAFVEGATPQAWGRIAERAVEEDVLPAKGPARSPAGFFEGSKHRLLKNENLTKYLGLSSVPLPHPVSKRARAQRWEEVLPANQAKYEELRQSPEATLDQSIEVHLRKLDDPLVIHRRVVASISIPGTAEQVWAVLTDYEKLPEVVPNIVLSQRLETPQGAPGRLVRLRQVGHKSFMYMHLYAEADLALVETPVQEIQFKQIVGDFQTLQGKLMIQEDDDLVGGAAGVILKYAVEVEIPRTTALMGVLDPLLERIVYQDIPSNLSAVKRRVRQLSSGEEELKEDTSDMKTHFPALQEELVSVFGEDGPLPKLSTLQRMERWDLEEAITKHGGVRQVARLMGWRVVGRSPSPWYDLKSTQEAFEAFAEGEGLPPRCLPNLDMLKRVGRRDMMKGAEEWGGIEELAELLEFEVAADIPIKSDYKLQLEAQRAEQPLAAIPSRRPKVRAMCEDFDVLAEELQLCFGEDGHIPSSTELRSMKRSDLEKAISHHGGGAEVSRRLGWKQQYRSPNYWADLENCRSEINGFCREVGAPQDVMPSVYSMQQAGRYDLQRAIRHWGGQAKLADALGWQVLESSSTSTHLRRKISQNSAELGEKKALNRNPKTRKSSKQMRDEIDSW